MNYVNLANSVVWLGCPSVVGAQSHWHDLVEEYEYMELAEYDGFDEFDEALASDQYFADDLPDSDDLTDPSDWFEHFALGDFVD